MNTQVSEAPFYWMQAVCRYQSKSFALIISSWSYEFSMFTTVQIKKWMLKGDKEICLWSCSQMSELGFFFFFHPNRLDSRTDVLELTDRDLFSHSGLREDRVGGGGPSSGPGYYLSSWTVPCMLAGTILNTSLQPHSLLCLGHVNSDVDLLPWVM